MLEGMKRRNRMPYVFHFLGFVGVFAVIIAGALFTLHIAAASDQGTQLPE